MTGGPGGDARGKARELAQWMDEAGQRAGVMAMVVADKLAEGDVDGARAALPAYQEAAAVVDGLGDELARVAGLTD